MIISKVNEMAKMPGKMKIGMGLGLLGGIIGIATSAVAWESTVASMTAVGLNLLVAVMFFAAAGFFQKDAPVAGATGAVLAGIAAASAVACLIVGAIGPVLGAIEIIIAVGLILIASCPTVKGYIDGVRFVE